MRAGASTLARDRAAPVDAARRSRVRVTPRALALLVVVAALLLAIWQPVRQYLGERDDIAGLEHDIAVLERENARLQAEIERLQDPRYIELLARKCLGMVKKGEIAIVPVPEGGQTAPADC